MARTIKMCDMSKPIAVTVFQMLNCSTVQLEKCPSYGYFKVTIVTDVEPKDLVYPEGWYYAKGCLRNKHTSTTGMYVEIPMVNSNGASWEDIARYSTLN